MGQSLFKKCFTVLLLCFLFIPQKVSMVSAAVMDLYGTIHAGGITVEINASDDPNHNLAAVPWYRKQGEINYREGFPLTRVNDTRLVGSLFWLDPNTTYQVELRFTDPDGGLLHNSTLASSLQTQADPVIPAPIHTYYVSPGGSGTLCSIGSPCSLSTATQAAQAGEAIFLRGGTYYEGEYTLSRSGTAENPIRIQSYLNETAVLDGSDPTGFTWTPVGGGIYRTTIREGNPHLVTADGERLLPYLSYVDLQNLIWDTPGFYLDGSTLYVRLASDANPNGINIKVSRHNTAFTISGNHIIFNNLTFTHYGSGSYAKALYFYNASNNLVNYCTFEINDLSIGVKYASHRNIFQNNTFSDTLFDWPWDAFYAGISLSSGGIRFYSPTTGRGNIIRQNTFHDYFDGFGACPDSAGTATNETDVYQNLVYRAADDGMEADGRCANLRIWQNTFHDVLAGVSLAPVYDGPVYAIQNLIYNTGVGNNNYSCIPFKFNSGFDKSGSMYLFHNTVDAALPDNNGFYVKAPGSWDLIYSRNNIWSGTDYALHNYNETQPIDLDYDNLYTTRANELVYWGSDADRHMRDLPTFQALTGQEPHGLNKPPFFSDSSETPYTLSGTSELINRGLHIPGINDGFFGTAPDIGAFEYEGFGVQVTLSPAVLHLEAGSAGTIRLDIISLGGFDKPITLSVTSPDPALQVQITPENLTPPGSANLQITDAHTPSTTGLWFQVPVQITSTGIDETVQIPVLIGGSQIFLPLINH